MTKLMQVDLTKIAKPVNTKKRKRAPTREVPTSEEEVKAEPVHDVEVKEEVKEEPPKDIKEEVKEPPQDVEVKEEKEDPTREGTHEGHAIKSVPKKEKKPLTEKQLAAIEKRKLANAEKKKQEQEEIERKEREVAEKELEIQKKKEAAAEKRRLKKAEKQAQVPAVAPVIKYIEKTIEVPRNDAKTRFELEYERGFRRMGQAVFGRSYQISKRMC